MKKMFLVCLVAVSLLIVVAAIEAKGYSFCQCYNENLAEDQCEAACSARGSFCAGTAPTWCVCTTDNKCNCRYQYHCWDGTNGIGYVDYPACPDCYGF